MKPLISVILPVYNIERYLQKCMDSLFLQSYSNIEFVVVDDGSQQKCAKKCDDLSKQDSRVVVYHKENGGLSDARNYGIEKAKGEYITCIDPDDYVDDNYIEYLYELIEKYNTNMSICQHRVIKNDRVIDYGRNYPSEVVSAKQCIERMLYHDIIDTSAWAKMYHKDLFVNIDYPIGKIFEDIGTTYKLMIESKQIAVGYESKYSYVIRDNSIVNASFNEKKLDLICMTDTMADGVLEVYPELYPAVKRRQIYARFSTLNQMIDVKGLSQERNEIIEYIKVNKKYILNSNKAPKRDKIATILLSISYRMYSTIWKLYNK